MEKKKNKPTITANHQPTSVTRFDHNISLHQTLVIT